MSEEPIWEWVWLGLVWLVLAVISLHDIRTMEIPYKFNGMILALGVMAAMIFPDMGWAERLWGIGCLSVPMILVNGVRHESFGGGDILLIAAAGLMLGWRGILQAGMIAMVAGGLIAAVLLASGKKRRHEHFAFGPALALGIGWIASQQVW